MKKLLKIKNLTLEMTRRCNYTCPHCMRGESQNYDLSIETINKLFDNEEFTLVEVEDIFITGGEPFYNPEAFLYLIEKIWNSNVQVKDFGCIVNGSIYEEKVMKSLEKLLLKGVNVKLFTNFDQYHFFEDSVVAKLRQYEFYEYRKANINNDLLYRFGRAKANDLGDVFLTAEQEELFYRYNYSYMRFWQDKDYLLVRDLYVTAKGTFGNLVTYNADYEMIDSMCVRSIVNDSLFDDAIIKLENLSNFISYDKYERDKKVKILKK